jgi:hypothetical protein
MQTDGFQAVGNGALQEVIGFCTYLSKTYGSGDTSRDGLATLTALVLIYTLLKLISHCNEDESTEPEFEEAVGIVSEALDLASIQLSEMRYQLLTEFDKAKRSLEFVRQERALNGDEISSAPVKPLVPRSLPARLRSTLGDSPINRLMGVSTPD